MHYQGDDGVLNELMTKVIEQLFDEINQKAPFEGWGE
jgi:hypothetical protein